MAENENAKRLELVLDFSMKIGKEMLKCGADIGRVKDSITRICTAYDLQEIHIFLLNSIILLSARLNGSVQTSQICVESIGVHLEKVSRYNQLSREVCEKKPEPEKLLSMLENYGNVKEYSSKAVLCGYLTAMTCLTMLFGGTWRDVLEVDLITMVMYIMMNILEKPGVNRIVYNLCCTWIAGVLSIFLVRIGLGEHLFVIIITNSMLFVPGIPLVNSIRDILCGNEMNGILELLKTALSTLAIVGGYCISIIIFGE